MGRVAGWSKRRLLTAAAHDIGLAGSLFKLSPNRTGFSIFTAGRMIAVGGYKATIEEQENLRALAEGLMGRPEIVAVELYIEGGHLEVRTV